MVVPPEFLDYKLQTLLLYRLPKFNGPPLLATSLQLTSSQVVFVHSKQQRLLPLQRSTWLIIYTEILIN